MNRGWIYKDKISQAGVTLLEYYAQRYQHSTQEEWLDRIRSSAISINNIPNTDPDTVLQRGQVLNYHRAPWIEPEVSFEIAILYEDDQLLIVDKPSGLPVLPGGGFLENTLWGWLRREYKTPPVPVHRLGRGTSGVIVLAKTEEARSSLSKQLRVTSGSAGAVRRIQKRYRALAVGIPEKDEFTIDTRIGKVAYPQLGYLYAATETGKEAISNCIVLERNRVPNATLLEVTIPTGRPHQIRIHLAFAGYPLLGDPLYGIGGIAIDHSSIPSDCGYLLHSYEVCLNHPIQAKLITVQSPPPELLSPSKIR